MEVLGDYSTEISRDEELAWEVFLQGLDITSGNLVNRARKQCKNPLTLIQLPKHTMVEANDF